MTVPKSTLRKRAGTYYLDYFEHGARHRVSLQTASRQVALDRQRQFDSARVRGHEDVLPTQTPLAEVVAAYLQYMETTRTRRGCVSDRSYLRQAFGVICPELGPGRQSRRQREARVDRRLREPRIEALYLEQITTAQVAAFIRQRVERHGIQPKTANRYREVLRRLFNWAMVEGGVRMPGDRNPAARVQRYRERAPEIRFLSRQEIGEQLAALKDHPALQALVAVYIYAGLRREEALWLTRGDVDLDAGRYGVLRVRAKTVDGVSWQPKTRGNRAVPVSRALRRYLDAYPVRLVPGGWFFPSPKGARWDADNFAARLRKVNRAVGLPWTCLDFRHTFGSHLAMKGESLYKISTLMGNSPEICRRHYAALLPEALVDCVEFDEGPEEQRPDGPDLRVLPRGRWAG